MAYDERSLRGVGGWLAFFVLSIALFQPLRLIYGAFETYDDQVAAAAFGDAWSMIRGFGLARNAVVILGGWYIAWRLLKVQVRRTVRITIASVWLLGVGVNAVDFIAVSFLSGQPLAGLVSTATTVELIRPVAFGAIWTAYFLRSRRVANTYPDEMGRERLDEVFS